MEESEKRRERLRAMRNEAFVAEGSSNLQSPVETSTLANPLVDTPIVQDSHAAPRFDYYTDPMAAYSGNKRQSNINQCSRDHSISSGGSSSAGGGNPMMQLPPPPSLGPKTPQMTSQPNYHPNEGMQQGWRNPEMTTQPNYHPDEGMQQGWRNPQMMSQPNYHPDQGMQQGWRPPYYSPGPIRPPTPAFNPYPEHQHHGFPNQPFNPSGHYPQMPRPGNWAGLAGPTNLVRGGTYYPNPGRGRSRGQWTNSSPSPSGSGSAYGRRGSGFGNQSDDTPKNLYRKSMVEDPWKDLKPVVWRADVRSELFHKLSSVAKKPKVEEECIVPRFKKEGLADYLAAAFDEAVDGGGAL